MEVPRFSIACYMRAFSSFAKLSKKIFSLLSIIFFFFLPDCHVTFFWLSLPIRNLESIGKESLRLSDRDQMKSQER